MNKLDAAGIYQESEIDGLVGDFLAHKGNNALNKWVTPARHRFRDRERQAETTTTTSRLESWAVPQGRGHLPAPVRLSVPDRQLRGPSLEKLSIYLRHLAPTITTSSSTTRSTSRGRFRLHRPPSAGHRLGQASGGMPLQPAKEAGTGAVRDPEMVPLDVVIEKINDLFSGDHPESSVRNVVTHVKDRLEDSETLQQQARTTRWHSSRPARTCTTSSSRR